MPTANDTGADAIRRTYTYVATSRWVEGDPVAVVHADGQLTTRPTGDSGDLYLSMSVARWRNWNRIVEAAILAHRDQHIAVMVDAVPPSHALDELLQSEGVEL